MGSKESKLFIILGGFFITNAVLAEFIGVKLFSLEKTFGFSPVNLDVFGNKLSFTLTAGVLLWPFVFVMTDIINEYFGIKGVRFLSYLAAGLIGYCFLMITLANFVSPDDWWEGSLKNQGISSYNQAFLAVFGQSNWIILGSLSAFLIGQMVDVYVFQWLKEKTGSKMIWLRATGSTLVSQLIDSFVVLYIAFYLGQNWSINLVLAVMVMNYIYKFMMAILLTPVIYWIHYIIDRFLGKEVSEKMVLEATLKN